jgi:hypothetical protein
LGVILRLPPSTHDWTEWERRLLDGLLVALAREGIDATRYEWLTMNEVWCTFRLHNADKVVDVGRFGRAYHLKFPHSRKLVQTFDISDALHLIAAEWCAHL